MKITMKNCMTGLVMGLLCVTGIAAQGNSASNNSNSADDIGLDLYAVAELFKESDNLEKFEQKLNDPENGINNLDLNNDDKIDFIRAVEQVKDSTHLIILQVALGENDFQDVATIAVESESGEKYNLQIQGDTVIYGSDYYVVPASSNFSAWNVVRWIFTPNYHPYVSPYNFHVLPRYWTVRRPIASALYHTRTGIFAGRRNFVASRTLTVRSINKISYHPRTSTVVTRRVTPNRVTTVKVNTNRNTVTKTVHGRKP